MNEKERIDLVALKIEVGNNTKQLEKILTNDLPHLQSAGLYLRGKMAVLSPLTVGIAVGVAVLIVGLALSIFL